MSLKDYIDQEKKELALQMSAALLLAKIKMMQYEFFHPTQEELQEVAS
jgi:hypothetical protein